MSELTENREFYQNIKSVLEKARLEAYRVVNFSMVEAYWNIGRLVVEEEQKGENRAEYGTFLITNLSNQLTKDFGKGFDPSNLKRMRQFYLTFPNSATLWHQLTWSHYKLLIRVKEEKARHWYGEETASQNWSVRVLERQINSLYYQRLLVSQDKESIQREADEKNQPLQATPQDFIKDPYVLEFLDLKPDMTFLEKELEQGLIDQLQKFLLELGKGFAFVARQQRVKAEHHDFYIDLVFYNYILKCFVLIDLKTGGLTHQDIGQMDMYTRIYEDKMKNKGDNPTVGLILCTEKDETVVKYSVLHESQQLFASRYQRYLPTEKELVEEIEREKAIIRQHKLEEE